MKVIRYYTDPIEFNHNSFYVLFARTISGLGMDVLFLGIIV
jgi:hypothetical protein